MNIKLIAIPAIALAAGLSLGACGSQSAPVSHQSASASHSAAPAKPQSAVSIVKADGYTTSVQALTAAQIIKEDHAADTIQLPDSAVTEGAQGVKGSNTETVIIFGGQGGAAQAQADAAIITSLAKSLGANGLVVHVNGDVLTATGPTSSSTNYTAAPVAAPKPTPTINYGQQYLADVKTANADGALIGGDSITAPAVATFGAATAAAGKSLLAQTWPANAQADIKVLATDMLKINADVQSQDQNQFVTDAEATLAQANIVRIDLGLPPDASATH